MKRLLCLISAVILCAVLCACSLDYSTTETEGCFKYACGERNAFVYEYIWDGTEDGLTVNIPATYGNRKVIQLGGYFGRGLPMPFSVNITDWLETQPGEFAGDEDIPNETVILNFTVITGPGIKETHLYGEQRAVWVCGDIITEYIVNTFVER